MSATLDNPPGCAAGHQSPGSNESGSGAPQKYDRIVADLARRGWSVCPDFLDTDGTAILAREISQLSRSGALRPARIGRGGERAVHPEQRGDRIFWLDRNACTAMQRSIMEEFETLRLAVNRALFLGLFEYEGHLTAYGPGTFYRRHLDQFRGGPQRVVSCILYLNAGWQEADGGQLRIFFDDDADGSHIDIFPHGGTLVTFLSGRFYHEVLPATRERLSLTGWLRTRG